MNREEFLKKLKAHDRSAIQYLYDTSYKSIEHHVVRQGGQQADAEDIFQEAILILYNKIENPAFVLTSEPGAYLLGISKYLLMRYQKKSRKILISDDIMPNLMDEDHFEKEIFDNEKFDLYCKHFDRLGKDCQRVLKLFFKKTSMIDIAKLMGYASEAYAKKRKFNCQKKLIAMIKADPLYNELSDRDD